jgi:hypothetical protein
MSSIYKKGRDGFFYYQTYLFNAKTGRKDKKIFHALGTKDRVVAEAEQKKYDSKYSNKNKVKWKGYKIFLILPIALISVLIYAFLEMNLKYGGLSYINDNEIILLAEDSNTKLIKTSDALSGKISELNNVENAQFENLNGFVPSTKIVNNQLPKYKILKVENISKAFNQCRIFASIQEPYEKRELEYLCDKIRLDFRQFSNIVICLFSDFENNHEIEIHSLTEFNESLIQKTWLAFYTYNPVEGSFFEENPGKYTGSF